MLFCSNARSVFLFWDGFSNSVFSDHFSACGFLLKPIRHKSEVTVHSWSPIRTYLCLCQCHVSCLGVYEGLLVYLLPSVISESFFKVIQSCRWCTWILQQICADVKTAWMKLSNPNTSNETKLHNPIFNMAPPPQSYIKHWSRSPRVKSSLADVSDVFTFLNDWRLAPISGFLRIFSKGRNTDDLS